MSQRRFLCTRISKPSFETINHHQNHNLKSKKWAGAVIKQVKKSNFSEALEEIRTHVTNSDFVAVSSQKTGAFSSPWQKALPFDTAEIAYCKAKYAAERFQPSYLTAMAREGFDFNACINDGISYLSRSQESAAKGRTGNPLLSNYTLPLQTQANSVADSMFVERVKSRVRNWITVCQDSEKKTDDALISSLRKIVSGSEVFGSRPSLTIDICSERQVQLIMEVLKDFANVVPLLVPAMGGAAQAIQVVLTTSKEDNDIFKRELQFMEVEHNKRVRGFREVIDLISTSQKPVVAHNSINEFTFVHSKFLAPLPSSIDEFRSSLHSVFSHILDVNHLLREIGHQKKLNNLPAAIFYLKRRFTVPLKMEIPRHIGSDEVSVHGHDALRISEIFAKLCLTLKVVPESAGADDISSASILTSQANIFDPCLISSSESFDEDVGISTDNTRRISTGNLIFLWGFGGVMSACKLRSILTGSHEVFSGEFDVRMADRKSAVVAFRTPSFAKTFLELMDSGGVNCEPLKDLISEGLRAAGYGTYRRVCEQGLWETDLADALDRALEGTPDIPGDLEEDLPLIYWDNDEFINLSDL